MVMVNSRITRGQKTGNKSTCVATRKYVCIAMLTDIIHSNVDAPALKFSFLIQLKKRLYFCPTATHSEQIFTCFSNTIATPT